MTTQSIDDMIRDGIIPEDIAIRMRDTEPGRLADLLDCVAYDSSVKDGMFVTSLAVFNHRDMSPLGVIRQVQHYLEKMSLAEVLRKEYVK